MCNQETELFQAEAEVIKYHIADKANHQPDSLKFTICSFSHHSRLLLVIKARVTEFQGR